MRGAGVVRLGRQSLGRRGSPGPRLRDVLRAEGGVVPGLPVLFVTVPSPDSWPRAYPEKYVEDAVYEHLTATTEGEVIRQFRGWSKPFGMIPDLILLEWVPELVITIIEVKAVRAGGSCGRQIARYLDVASRVPGVVEVIGVAAAPGFSQGLPPDVRRWPIVIETAA